MGITFQYTTSRISRAEYDRYHSIYYDEVFRLNPPSVASAPSTLHPDDSSVRATEEFRFLLLRHWNLYDAMYHSSYVAGKLGIWRERGKKKLTGLLAKMGYGSRTTTLDSLTKGNVDFRSCKLSNPTFIWIWTLKSSYGPNWRP
jgi:CDC45-like protein